MGWAAVWPTRACDGQLARPMLADHQQSHHAADRSHRRCRITRVAQRACTLIVVLGNQGDTSGRIGLDQDVRPVPRLDIIGEQLACHRPATKA